MDLCHGQNIYAACSRVLEVIYSMFILVIMKRAGLESVKVEKACVGDIVSVGGLKNVQVGDIVSVGGLKNVQVGDTLAHMEVMTCLPPLFFDVPEFFVVFGVNDSPFASHDGKKVTIGQLYDRLVTRSNTSQVFKVYREGASLEAKESVICVPKVVYFLQIF